MHTSYWRVCLILLIAMERLYLGQSQNQFMFLTAHVTMQYGTNFRRHIETNLNF